MRDELDLSIIAMEIYIELFKQAEPSADFIELEKSGFTKKKGWFSLFYMPQEKQEKIMNKIMSNHTLNRLDKRAIRREINTGCSPNTCRNTWSWERDYLDTLDKDILTVIRNKPNFYSTSSIAKRLCIGEATARRHLQVLKIKEKVKRNNDGAWIIADGVKIERHCPHKDCE